MKDRQPITIKISERVSTTVGSIAAGSGGAIFTYIASPDSRLAIFGALAAAALGGIAANTIHESIAAGIGDKDNPKS